MQPARATNERKAKLARSYQELLDDFNNTDLKTVGNYQLGRLIGKGSFGKVYLASHKLTNGSKVGGGGDSCTCQKDIKTLTVMETGRAQVRKER